MNRARVESARISRKVIGLLVEGLLFVGAFVVSLADTPSLWSGSRFMI
jgi:hypothetical protein